MSMTVHPLDDMAAGAVDALEPGERAAVEAHVATCAGCRAELNGHREALSWVVEDEQPPPWLWDQIVADARAVRPPAVPSVPSSAPASSPSPPEQQPQSRLNGGYSSVSSSR